MANCKGLVIGASMGNCVHVAGASHFLALAADEGYDTMFLGPAVSVNDIIDAIVKNSPSIVTLGYRLTPENVVPLVKQLQTQSTRLAKQPVWVFGGTRPVAETVRELDFFDVIFDGTDDIDDSITFLRTGRLPQLEDAGFFAQNVCERISQKSPYPLLRHHFGLPSFADTVHGIEKIAESRVLDIISLGIDQNTQQFFFHPENRDSAMDGAGGVPVKSVEEFRTLKKASQTGNFPLMRCYSGTDNVTELAEVLKNSIDNAWCAVPLCWYNELDGRGTRPLEHSIQEAQKLMRWHGKLGIPVEVNEPHHWGLRDTHDTISVAMSYISAYNAKKSGVGDYISQYMFNIPNSMSFSMDLAKVLAQVHLTESLAGPDFRVYRQTRAGLPFLSGDLDVAKGQLAASTALSMNIKPHIIHVVGYSEAEHAATPEVVIESCKIVRGVIRSTLSGNADATQDSRVIQRRDELLREAEYLIDFIVSRYKNISDDPLSDPAVITDCVKTGILDAPQILKSGDYCGRLKTRVFEGKCLAYDESEKRFLTESERLNTIGGVLIEKKDCSN